MSFYMKKKKNTALLQLENIAMQLPSMQGWNRERLETYSEMILAYCDSYQDEQQDDEAA